MQTTIRARAPVRIDFAGGWTDVALFCQEDEGKVINAAINLYAYVTVKPLLDVSTTEDGCQHQRPRKFNQTNNGVKIYSVDFNQYVEAKNIKDLEYQGTADLAVAAVKCLNIEGIEVVTRSDAPAGSGLGSSAAMGVALCGVLSKYANDKLLFAPPPEIYHEIAEMACEIEQKELNILGGKQDQYASALGGFNCLGFQGDEVKVYRMSVKNNVILELEKSLVLCYTGQSRLSSDIHAQVRDSFLTGTGKTRDALWNLRQVANELQYTLEAGSLERFGELLNENWRWQKELHPAITNGEINAIMRLAKKHGAQGGKACGAGGGGCLVFYCPEAEHAVTTALRQDGIRVLDFNFDASLTGLRTWRLP